MPSSYNNEGSSKLKLSKYENLQQLTQCMSCPASCSCNLGERSSYDQMQYNEFVLGKNPFNLPASERPTSMLPAHYNSTANCSKKDLFINLG